MKTKPTQTSTASQNNASQQARPVTPLMTSRPSHEAIAQRAYDIYSNKNCRQGQCQQNWQQAERELQKEPATADSCNDNKAVSAGHAPAEPATKTFAQAKFTNMTDKGPVRGGKTILPPGNGNQ